jgi:hypothetical protein
MLTGGIRSLVVGTLGLIAGATVAWLAFSMWNDWVDNPSVRAAAQQHERAAWEDATRKLRDQMDAERRSAQARIDDAERSYLAARQREAGLVADLETAITAMEADNAETDDAGCACRPALPRGLGLQLDAIGR